MQTDHLLERLRVLLAGRYRFETLLGRGGSATVYTVTNLNLDRLEALKVLKDRQQGDAEFAERFANEARVAASLDHPSIVKVYDYGDPEGICWYSMQLVDGPTLSSELRSRGTFEPVTAVRLFLPILDALAYSHDRGVVHRDIKPSNINIDPRGRTFLMDFGIAKSTASMLETRTGLVLGTPAYVAPEQASGQPLDGRADLYAVGVTLYQMLCGAYPFTADNILQTVVMRMAQDPEPLRDKLPGIDPRLESIVMRALARDRNARFIDARSMREALAECCGDLETAFVPEATGPGRGAPLFDDDESVDRATATYVATSKSEAAELRRLRRRRQVRKMSWVAGGALVLTLSAVGFFGWRSAGSAPDGNPGQVADVQRDGVSAAVDTRDEQPADGPANDNLMQPVGEGDEAANSPAEAPVRAQPTSAPPIPTPTPIPEPPRQPWERPRLLEDPSVSLPADLARACAGEVVRLSLRIDDAGAVSSVKVISSGHQAICAEHAAGAVKGWRYEPAKDIDGVPLAANLSVAFPFREVPDESPENR